MRQNKPVESLEFYVPIKLVSEANRGSEHWTARMRRKKDQQLEMIVALHNNLLGRTVRTPCVVKLTRIGPKLLDKDNLAGAFKFTRDIDNVVAASKNRCYSVGYDESIR